MFGYLFDSSLAGIKARIFIIFSKDVSQYITLWDERLSSQGAFKLSNDLEVNVSKRVKKLDENSAQFILQGALDYLKKKNT